VPGIVAFIYCNAILFGFGFVPIVKKLKTSKILRHEQEIMAQASFASFACACQWHPVPIYFAIGISGLFL
jgi:hypothetical protein